MERIIKETEHMRALVAFAVERGMVEAEDASYAFNRLMEIMERQSPSDGAKTDVEAPRNAAAIMTELAAIAASRGVIDDSADARDRFCARLAGAITPEPAAVRREFFKLYAEDGPEAATNWFYALCRDCDYIRVERIAKNVRFMADSPSGELEITINLSKPEKDPRDIAKQRALPQQGYPKCMLCAENPGYAGRPGYPARQNHRMVPLTLNSEKWYFQYSPYLYYNEHCIVLNSEHRPMKMGEGTFRALFDFVEQFPHYFLGSNADLPIVGGSILTHDHFQGGKYVFPMDRAPIALRLNAPIASVEACVVDWPLTCVRLESARREDLERLGMEMLTAWRSYSDSENGILAMTDAPHNAITPVARRVSDAWRLDLILRNNRTDDVNPLGIFHPHSQLHHIKKENIGLIEAMGLFILPGRLLGELDSLCGYLTGEVPLERVPDESSPLYKHYSWIRDLALSAGKRLDAAGARSRLRLALADKCSQVLCDAGVFKRDERGRAGLLKFLSSAGYSATK